MAAGAAGTPPRVKDLLGCAVAEAERAAEIVGQLRHFVGKGEIEYRGESLNALVEETLALRQIVLDLVRNAVEAMEAGTDEAGATGAGSTAT